MSRLTTFTGTVPYHYDTFLGPLFFEPYALDLVQRVRGKTERTVLELACGTGRVTRHLVAKLPEDGRLYATDLNSDMLQVAKQQLHDSRIRWSAADAQALPFEQNQFDLVVCQFGVMFFTDKPKAFANVFRVLKNGGRFVFNTWDELRVNALAHLTEEVLQEEFPKDSPAFFMRGPHSFFDPAEIENLLQAAGFAEIKVETLQKNGTAVSPEAAVTGVLDGTPLSPYLKEHSEQAKRVRQRLTERLAQQYGQVDLSLPMQALVCEAVKP